jgi:hypothetical protein
VQVKGKGIGYGIAAALAAQVSATASGLARIGGSRTPDRADVNDVRRFAAGGLSDNSGAARLGTLRDSEIALVFRYPSLRSPLDILFLVACVALTADVLVPEIWGHGKTKDYALWFWAGQQVLAGKDLYPAGPDGYLEFIYPPLPAILLAIPSYFGKIPLYLDLSLLNAAAWWMTSQLSNAMTGSDKIPGPWLAALPGFATVTFVFDMFDLGQPNLILLAMMLLGFWLLQHGRAWSAGSLFALATAIKVFPVAVFPYLLWRRRWATAASMVVFLGIFLEGIWATRRAELVVGQSIHHCRDASADTADQLQSKRGERPATHHESGRSRLQDRELDRARRVASGRAWIHRADSASVAIDAAFQCRGTGNPVLLDDGRFAAGPPILFHVAVLPDDHLDSPRCL